MLRCKDAAVALTKSLDGETSRVERWGLRFHLLICRSCSRVKRQLTAMRQLARTLDEHTDADAEIPTSGDGLSDDARQRMRDMLRQREK